MENLEPKEEKFLSTFEQVEVPKAAPDLTSGAADDYNEDGFIERRELISSLDLSKKAALFDYLELRSQLLEARAEERRLGREYKQAEKELDCVLESENPSPLMQEHYTFLRTQLARRATSRDAAKEHATYLYDELAFMRANQDLEELALQLNFGYNKFADQAQSVLAQDQDLTDLRMGLAQFEINPPPAYPTLLSKLRTSRFARVATFASFLLTASPVAAADSPDRDVAKIVQELKDNPPPESQPQVAKPAAIFVEKGAPTQADTYEIDAGEEGLVIDFSQKKDLGDALREAVERQRALQQQQSIQEMQALKQQSAEIRTNPQPAPPAPETSPPSVLQEMEAEKQIVRENGQVYFVIEKGHRKGVIDALARELGIPLHGPDNIWQKMFLSKVHDKFDILQAIEAANADNNWPGFRKLRPGYKVAIPQAVLDRFLRWHNLKS